MKGLIKYILALTIAFIVSTASAYEFLPDGLDMKINMGSAQFNSFEPIQIHVTVKNTTLENITFLKWNTPFESSIKSDLFSIQDSQLKPINYIGRIINRATPTDNDHLTLAPGESRTSSLDLSLAYDIKKAGNYTLNYSKNSHLTKTLSFFVSKDRIKPALHKEINGVECTTEQNAVLETALPEAAKIASISATLLEEISEKQYPIAERYTQWFGSYYSDHYQTISTGFSLIKEILDNNQVEFSCTCEENAIAFVYPDNPYVIHICPAFWNLNLRGTDSQSGTIIHELTHFRTTLNTDDFVYGKKKSLELAESSPEKAVLNADNYEYFSENNNPYLAMYTATLADSHEPDNSKVTAKLITEEQPQIYTIHTNTDADWLKFEVLSDSYVNIHTIGPYKGDTELRLYNEAGEEISFGDDIDPTINNNYSEIGIDGLKKGTYFIKVTGYKSSALVTEYKITLTILPQGSGKTFESETNQGTSNENSSSGSILWPTLILLLFTGLLRRNIKSKE